MTRVAIIGTGDLAYGLCSFFKSNNGGASVNSLVVTKKNLEASEEDTCLHDTGVHIKSFSDAINQAEVIVLAIPAPALHLFVKSNYHVLKDKILVDATNPTARDQDLKAILSVTDVRWVKAFNDVGAIDGMLSKPTYKEKTPSKMCSPNVDALKVVKAFAEESLGFHVKVVPYEKYDEIALHQNSYGTEWVIAFVYMAVFFVLFQ